MDNSLDDLKRIARRCERAASPFEADEFVRANDLIQKAVEEVARSASGSWQGWQSEIYLRGLRPRSPSDIFDEEWFGTGISDSTHGDWCQYPYEAVQEDVFARAGVDNLDRFREPYCRALAVFEDSRSTLLRCSTRSFRSGMTGLSFNSEKKSSRSLPISIETRSRVHKVQRISGLHATREP